MLIFFNLCQVRHWTNAQVEQYQYTNAQLGPSSCAPAAVLTSLNMIRALPQDAGIHSETSET